MLSDPEFPAGTRVRVWMPDLSIEMGSVRAVIYSSGKVLEYGIQLDSGGYMYASPDRVFPEIKNTYKKCTCGSDKLGHPGHSYFCDKDERKTK